MEKLKPIDAIKAAPFRVSVWENVLGLKDGKIMTRYNISLTKSWRDKNDEWQTSTIHMDLDEVPKIITACREAYKLRVLEQSPKEID